LRFIDGTEVHSNLNYPDLMDALEAAHRDDAPRVGRSLLEPPSGTRPPGEGFLVHPSWAPGRAFGVKMVTILPDNARMADGPPTIQAIYQLFDGETGTPVMTIDGTALTLWKTAADSALGSRLLSRGGAKTLLMVGAGALAPHLITAHLAARPGLERVMIWNRTGSRCDEVAAQLDHGIESVEDLDAAVSKADIISVATMASEPLVQGKYLKPGTHVDLVGGYTVDMREADDETMRRARIYVNYWDATVGNVGDLTQPVQAGVITEDDILGDLFSLCQNRVAKRQNDDQITVYKNGGGGHLDLFTAEHLAACLNGR
jgi:ornithine cyclodeaminase/alanine dehydrogenase-like protein (mu-crystallin family)